MFERRIQSANLNREIWITLHEDPDLIEIQFRTQKLAKSVEFHNRFFQLDSAAKGSHTDLIEEIRRRAYELWNERVGRHAVDDWLQG